MFYRHLYSLPRAASKHGRINSIINYSIIIIVDFWYVLNFRYNRLSRHIRELAKKIKDLDPNDPFRTEATAQLLEKL